MIEIMESLYFGLIADSTTSVIYGTEPALLESDKFSEISLDQTVDVDQQFAALQSQTNRKNYIKFSYQELLIKFTSIIFILNKKKSLALQNLDAFSSSATLDEPQHRDETIFSPLAQATAIKDSLSQLPGVASSVFSSFSNILKGTSSPNQFLREDHTREEATFSNPSAQYQEYQSGM